MKMMKCLAAAMLMVGVAAWSGCSKGSKDNTPAGGTVQVNGVAVAMPQLQQSLLASKDPTVQAGAGKLAYNMRYANYAGVQDELTKLAANPSLTDDQKKLVATVQDQIKQAEAAKQAAQ